MQLQDKLVDGLEAAKQESRQREDVEELGDEQLPAPVVEALQDAESERRKQLLGAVRMLLDGQELNIARLRLPKRETVALEAMQVATTGRSGDTGQFVYASDRRDILERALGVLQPDLAHGSAGLEHELAASFADLSDRVADLRESLSGLEDAQDELLDGEQKVALAKADGDTADKPPPDPDAPRPPTTLTGSPEAVRPEVPTTLTGGPEAEVKPVPSTLADGPEAVQPEAPSTLATGGPEAEARPDAPTTLGDSADIAQAQTPWWRRPFAG